MTTGCVQTTQQACSNTYRDLSEDETSRWLRVGGLISGFASLACIAGLDYPACPVVAAHSLVGAHVHLEMIVCMGITCGEFSVGCAAPYVGASACFFTKHCCLDDAEAKLLDEDYCDNANGVQRAPEKPAMLRQQ